MSYTGRRPRITYEGISFLSILAFIVLGSIMRQINLLVLLSGLMIAPFFFNWRVSMKMLERVRYRRRLPQMVHAQQPFSVTWEFANDKHSIPSWGLRLEDRLGSSVKDEQHDEQIMITVKPVPANSTVTVAYRCLLPERGVYQFGPAIASSAFPVGLIRSRSEVSQTDSLVVAPPIGQLSSEWKRMVRAHREGQDSRFRKRGSRDEEFYGIRRWRSGDSRKHVHWRSSARQGELMVRQFDQPSDSQLVVVLELHADSNTTGVVVQKALSFLTTVLRSSRSNTNLSVGVFGDQKLTGKLRSRQMLRQIMNMLATVQPVATTEIFDGLKDLQASVPGDASLVVIGTRTLQQALESESISPDERLLSSINWIQIDSEKGRRLFSMKPNATRQFVRDTMGVIDKDDEGALP